MKQCLLAGLLIFLTHLNLTFAQLSAPIGFWKSYLSHHSILEITQKGDEIYAISSAGLFSYDLYSKELKTYTKVEGLSETKPSTLYYAAEKGLLFIGYQSGRIDYFQSPSQIEYITDISRSTSFSSKTIHQFLLYNELLYIATDFGIVAYDPAARETRFSITKIDNNNAGEPVLGIAISQDTLWASMGSRGLYYAPLSQIITNPFNWSPAPGLNLPTGKIVVAQQRLYVESGDSILTKNQANQWHSGTFPNGNIIDLGTNQGVVYAIIDQIAYINFPSGQVQTPRLFSLASIFVQDNMAWIGSEVEGIYQWDSIFIKSQIHPPGPFNNFITGLAAGNRRIFIAPRGKKGFSDRHFDKSGFSLFDANTGEWKIYNQWYNTIDDTQIYQDFARAHFDPVTNLTYLGSWGEGIVEVNENVIQRYYTPLNSGLSASTGISSRVSGLATDDKGTLWACLIIGSQQLNAKTIDGQWYAFSLNSLNDVPIGILIDDFSTKWIINQNIGLIAFSENGTLAATADDNLRYLNTGSTQGNLPSTGINALAKDNQGSLWIATDDGVAVIYDPGSVFTNFFSGATQPIVDGFPLLRGQKVTTVAVDGANRKWFGTSSDGIFLIDAAGTGQLSHYTTENSPLPDNEIRAITIDGSTGEVFIGTAGGLTSFVGDATDGQSPETDLYAFPNPVPGGYEGDIAIEGSVAASTVKITTLSGDLVVELSSLGGRTLWDGRDIQGKKVAPGIYLALVADSQGQNEKVCNIVILER